MVIIVIIIVIIIIIIIIKGSSVQKLLSSGDAKSLASNMQKKSCKERDMQKE